MVLVIHGISAARSAVAAMNLGPRIVDATNNEAIISAYGDWSKRGPERVDE
jgi:hypothetical protein